jgi:zinc transport system substrate-binding protein
VLKISEQIYNGLVMIDPENEALYQENLESFRKEIEDLDLFIQNELSGLDNRQFIAYHPAWGYFAHEYQLEMLAVETGGQEPGAETLAQIITLAKTNDVRLIIMPLAYSSKNAETLAEEIDASVIILDPLAQDWLVGMQELASTLAGSMEN